MSFPSHARSWCTFLALLVSCAAAAQQPATMFAEQCSACHTIGGGAGAGPDLKAVGERRPRAWLIRFIRNPQALIAAQDATAVALQKEFAGMEMPTFPEITKAQAEALLDYIAQQSATAPPPVETPAPVVDPHAIETGRQIFLGSRRLARGGAACISCHTVRGLGGLGGGRFGPDLTRSFERLGKAKGITGWLSATPTPIMSAAYKRNPLTADEVGAVTAFLDQAGNAGSAGDQHARWKFVALAAGCTLLGFVAIGGTWRKRFRGVRERLESRRGEP